MTRAFKRLDELTKIDELHLLMGQLTGGLLSLEKHYLAVERITLNEAVPEFIQGQFNVARNMALYTFFFYALAPELQLKTFTVIELALKERMGRPKKMLHALLQEAVTSGLIVDSGFRHIENPEAGNPYSQSLIDTLPKLRNESAHGSTLLTPDVVWYLERCADLINQLYIGKN